MLAWIVYQRYENFGFWTKFRNFGLYPVETPFSSAGKQFIMNLKEPFVITVSREIGSGGRTIGQVLAKKLNVPCYDRYLIEALEKEFGLTVEEIEKRKSRKKRWLSEFSKYLSPVPSAAALGVAMEEEEGIHVTTDMIFQAEREILRELANEGSCVITGRSGFFVFENHPNHLNVFITAPYPNRINRIMKKQGMDENAAAALINKIDKARENYIQRYTNTSRYDVHNYDLAIKVDGQSEEQIAETIISFIEQGKDRQ